jgi:hypothetical protein
MNDFNDTWQKIADLKLQIREILDPSGESLRDARDHARAVVFRHWNDNLTALAADKSLADEFFTVLELVAFLADEAKQVKLDKDRELAEFHERFGSPLPAETLVSLDSERSISTIHLHEGAVDVMSTACHRG